jgi:hypothetical protein
MGMLFGRGISIHQRILFYFLKEFLISGYHSADIEAGKVGQESVDVM